MRVISINLNGIRAAHKKGFYHWLARQRADVVCIQETKAQLAQLTKDVASPNLWHTFYCDAEKKGYSGVAIFSKLRPDNVTFGLGSSEFDKEGRYIQADYGTLSIASVYFPSGSSGDLRQQAKFRFLNVFEQRLEALEGDGRSYIFSGDWNIAHKEIDLRNWKSNRKNSGFLPEERAWMDMVLDRYRYVDSFRSLDGRRDQYTWWSNRGRAWANNVGWRIDYQIISASLKSLLQKAKIYKDKRFSDHSPLIVDYAKEISGF
jgi:exodeoxyribonuclease-3